jgi:hypothetical protein
LPAEGETQPYQFQETGLGLSASIQRLREAEPVMAARWARTQDSVHMQDWIVTAEQLRKIEKDNPEIIKANDKALDADDVQATWATQINEFRSAPAADG